MTAAVPEYLHGGSIQFLSLIHISIELQDNFTSVLYQVINSVNLGLSAMEDLHQSMNAQVDTSSIEAARDSILSLIHIW